MPLTNFICPDGETIPITDCMNGCRMGTRCAPKPYLTMAAGDREWRGVPSVTQLLRGLRENVLKIRTDYAKSPDSSAFMIHGTKAHAVLEEKADSPLAELTLEYAGISGTIDLLEPDDLFPDSYILYDTKTSGAYAVAKAMGLVGVNMPVVNETGSPVFYRGKAKVEKVFNVVAAAADNKNNKLQANMYRVMFEHLRGKTITGMYNFFVVRDGGTYTAKNYGITKNTYMVPISRLDDSKILSHFHERRDKLLGVLGSDTPTSELICTEEERWDGAKCERFCEVRDECRRLKGAMWRFSE